MTPRLRAEELKTTYKDRVVLGVYISAADRDRLAAAAERHLRSMSSQAMYYILTGLAAEESDNDS